MDMHWVVWHCQQGSFSQHPASCLLLVVHGCRSRVGEALPPPTAPVIVQSSQLGGFSLLWGGSSASEFAHYHVLVDENGFIADGLQLLTYWLCYLYCCCSRWVQWGWVGNEWTV